MIEKIDDQQLEGLNEEEKRKKVKEIARNFAEDVENFTKSLEEKGTQNNLLMYNVCKHTSFSDFLRKMAEEIEEG